MRACLSRLPCSTNGRAQAASFQPPRAGDTLSPHNSGSHQAKRSKGGCRREFIANVPRQMNGPRDGYIRYIFEHNDLVVHTPIIHTFPYSQLRPSPVEGRLIVRSCVLNIIHKRNAPLEEIEDNGFSLNGYLVLFTLILKCL